MINLDDLKKASEIFFYFTSPFVALLVGKRLYIVTYLCYTNIVRKEK